MVTTTVATANVGLYGEFILNFLVPADAPTGVALLKFTFDCGHSATVPLVPFTVTNGKSGALCPRYLLGLHGMSQGPASSTDYTTSQEIVAVRQAFDNASAANKKAEFLNIPYPTTGIWDLANPVTNRYIQSDVAKGATALHNEITTLTKASRCSTFSLIGYSEGAWVIDLWLYEYNGDTKNVKDIAMLGDPWWYQVHNGVAAKGIARLFNLAYTAPPWPVQNTPYAVVSLCNVGDPICGEGFTNPAKQIAEAAFGKSTPHHQYANNGAAARVGQILANYAG